MEINQYEMTKEEAHKLWKEYVDGCKNNPKDKYLEDMKKVYNQLKSGRKLVDINMVFDRAGVHDDNHQPKLAICQADAEICYCKYDSDGNLLFSKRQLARWDDPQKIDVTIKKFPKLTQTVVLKTLVPPIPPSLRPKGDLSKYYILWDVDKWEIEPPKDPYLLKRVTGNMYVVLAGWDLTELERAVIRGRVW